MGKNMIYREWIPCSERLPEEDGRHFIVWCKYTDSEGGFPMIVDYYDGWNCRRDSDGSVMRDNEFKNVVAWMPSPEPYVEEEELL